jgi:hypothetical protein
MRSPVPPFGKEQTWASAVGLFLLNFGHLEFWLNAYLEKKLAPAEFRSLCERPFKERLERIAAFFATSAEQRAQYETFSRALSALRELRNHIAHGYLELVLRPNASEPVWGITRAKDLSEVFSTRTRHVTFEELTQHLADLSDATERFGQLTDEGAGWKLE